MALQPILELCPCIEVFQYHTIKGTIGLLSTSDQLAAEASTYTEKHNIKVQERNIHIFSGIQTRNPIDQAAKYLHLRLRGNRDKPINMTAFLLHSTLQLITGVVVHTYPPKYNPRRPSRGLR
jgi:hypothetical protein